MTQTYASSTRSASRIFRPTAKEDLSTIILVFSAQAIKILVVCDALKIRDKFISVYVDVCSKMELIEKKNERRHKVNTEHPAKKSFLNKLLFSHIVNAIVRRPLVSINQNSMTFE